jgi:uncharacterized membrane protein YjgN (DUF898 family)
MLKLSRILRWISLAFLFGGSVSIVYVAVSLLTFAQAHGIATEVAAAVNAPLFFQYTKLVVVAAFMLLIAESLDFAAHRSPSKLERVRYATSMLCAAAIMIFAFGLVPPMKKLSRVFIARPAVFMLNPAFRDTFKQYHETARIVFGASVLLALTSLLLPAFDVAETTRAKS